MADGALAGQTILVTRPFAQAESLAARIRAKGGGVELFPLLNISPLRSLDSFLDVIERIPSGAVVIFVSPNAVENAVSACRSRWPDWPRGTSTRFMAMGPGTQEALVQQGVGDVVCPKTRFDSEGLLDESLLAEVNIAGKTVIIVRGNGGRPYLADVLLQRGAIVNQVSVYERTGPSSWEALEKLCRSNSLTGWVVSSSEALRYLVNALSDECLDILRSIPLFVPHARIAEFARQQSFRQVILTEPADDGMIKGLSLYDW